MVIYKFMNAMDMKSHSINDTSTSTLEPAPGDITLINNDDLNTVIRAILVARAREGATIQEIRDDYYNLVGEKFPIYDNVTDYLLSIPNVRCCVNENRCRIFTISALEKSQHIIDMVKMQKPPRQKNTVANHRQEEGQHYPYAESQKYNQPTTTTAVQTTSSTNLNEPLKYSDRNVTTAQQPQQYRKYNNDNNNKNYKYQNDKEKENFYNNNNVNYNNIRNAKPPTNLKGSKNCQNYRHRQQEHRQPYSKYISAKQMHRPYQSTPMNESYNHELELNDIADYVLHGDDKYYNDFNNNNNNKHKDDNLCFFEDNYKYLYKKIAASTESLSTKPAQSNTVSFNSQERESEILRNFNNPFRNHNNNNESFLPYYQQYGIDRNQNLNDVAHIHDYQLLGDDFLLALARAEIGCKLKRGNQRHQSGLCVSGQTIQGAKFRILNEQYLHSKMIVNIGSVDILQEHHLIDIQQDFLQLLRAFKKLNIVPILTTLAPLANLGHRPDIKKNLECFNDFIRRSGLPYIDIWTTMVNQHGNTYYDCYQSGAKYVSGSIYPHVLWNNVGRQRILNKIKSELAFICI